MLLTIVVHASTDKTEPETEATGGLTSAPPTMAGYVGEAEAVVERVGRFRVLDVLGAGGMGVVYAAHDPDLDRTVALKLLHHSELSPTRQARLLREAQAMARLSHPNVTTVYEVGTHKGRVFVAMEMVPGETLEQWLHRERTWPQLWSVFRQAAAGLAAAHEAGIVHRDFKPSNVLIDDKGRARVTDFGIARATRRDDTPSADPSGGLSVELGVTKTGAVMGTPGYMAPEQYLGEPVDARTDQFAFCSALYRALYGEAPFAGKNVFALQESTLAGEVRPPPSGSAVPRWRRQILVRGLSRRPAERYASMHQLIAALDHDPVKRRRRIIGGGVMVVAFGGSIAFGALGLTRNEADPCAVDATVFEEAWGPERQEAVRAAFVASEDPAAERIFEQVEARLDRRVEQWVRARRDACVANRVAAEQSDTLFDRRVACLQRRLGATAALTEILTEADSAMISRAVAATEALPRIDDCADVELVGRVTPPPSDPEAKQRIAAIEEDLDRGRIRYKAGHVDKAYALAHRALEAAREVDYAPVLGEALVLRARSHEDSGEWDAANALLEEATEVLARAGHARAELSAWKSLVRVAVERHQLQRAHALMLSIQATLARVGDEPEARELVLGTEMELAFAEERFEDALDLGQQSLAILRDLLGADSVAVASRRQAIAGVKIQLGRPAEALQDLEEVVAIFESSLGENSTNLASALENLSAAYYFTSQYKEGEDAARRCYEIRKRLQNPSSPEVAGAANNLAILLGRQGKHAEALALFDEVLAIQKKALGEGHPDVATTLMGIGNVHRDAGGRDAAMKSYGEALAALDKGGARRGIVYAQVVTNMATLHVDASDCEAAMPLLQEGLVLFEEAHGPEHGHVADALTLLAECTRKMGRPAEAIPLAKRALAIHIAIDEGPDQRGDAGEILSHALWDEGSDRAQALEVAQQAQRDFAAAGRADLAARVAAWLKGKKP